MVPVDLSKNLLIRKICVYKITIENVLFVLNTTNCHYITTWRHHYMYLCSVHIVLEKARTAFNYYKFIISPLYILSLSLIIYTQ
jgi:hypothetical protein